MSRVRLDAIVFDAGTQVRAALDQDHVGVLADAMTSGAIIPPIVLFHDGNQHYIGDGFHRFMAAQRIQWREIDADVRAGAKDDALWFALGANKTNGKNMTLADKKHAIKLAVIAWPNRPAGEIAEQIGCSRSWVSEVRSYQDSATGKVTSVTGKDGKTYPASTAKRAEISRRIKAGESRDSIVKAVGCSASMVSEVRKSIGATASGHSSTTEARRSMAIEGAAASRLKKFPRKADASIVINALQTLDGIKGALAMVDSAALSSDPRATEWRATIAGVITVLRAFNRQLERKSA